MMVVVFVVERPIVVEVEIPAHPVVLSVSF
jgi:hypothetical protein